MMTANAYWKDKIDDLRELALDVRSDGTAEKISARTAARCLMGVVSLVTRRWTLDEMQRTCAELVRSSDVWASSFARLPLQVNGSPSEQIMLIAVVARSLLPLAGVKNLKAALSFWATENDPNAWNSLAA